MPLTVHSKDLISNAPIPPRFTCSGIDVSPALNWGDVPEGTESFALIVDDPDAPRGTFTHWVLFNIPQNVRGLPQNVERDPELSDTSRQGKNDFDNIGYGGPCPPPGHGPHRYFFKLYALDTRLDLPPGASKADLIGAMQGHVLEMAELMGTYERLTNRR